MSQSEEQHSSELEQKVATPHTPCHDESEHSTEAVSDEAAH